MTLTRLSVRLGHGRHGQLHVALVDRAHAAVDDADLHLVGVLTADGFHQRFDRALHVALDDQIDRLDVAGLHRLEQVVERDLALRAQRLLARQSGTFLGNRASAIDIVEHVKLVARGWKHIKTADDDRHRRRRRLDHLAVVIQQASQPAVACTGQQHIADIQRAILNQHGRHRAETLVDAAFDNRAACGSGWIRFEFQQLGLVIEQLDQLGNALARHRAGADDFGIAAPLDGIQIRWPRARRAPSDRSHPGRSILFIATMIGTSAALAWLIDSIVCG